MRYRATLCPGLLQHLTGLMASQERHGINHVTHEHFMEERVSNDAHRGPANSGLGKKSIVGEDLAFISHTYQPSEKGLPRAPHPRQRRKCISDILLLVPLDPICTEQRARISLCRKYFLQSEQSDTLLTELHDVG